VDVPDLEPEDDNPAVDGDLGLQVHGDPTVAVHGQGLVDGPALDGLDNPAVPEGPVPSIHGTVVDVQGLDLGVMPDIDLLDVHVEGHPHVDAINPPAVEEDFHVPPLRINVRNMSIQTQRVSQVRIDLRRVPPLRIRRIDLEQPEMSTKDADVSIVHGDDTVELIPGN
jgi:hypothetical protein